MASLLARLRARLSRKPALVIVSGLPRSGTSMMMKMLEAGGLPPMTDQVRAADEDNPRGYYEDERVKDLEKMQDKSWISEARGKALKVISFLLKELPPGYRYKVIFMRRDLREILASQEVMLERRDELDKREADEAEAVKIYERHLRKVDYLVRHNPDFDCLYVDYRAAIDDPRAAAGRVARFLGGRLDPAAMASAVDKSLYRQKRT